MIDFPSRHLSRQERKALAKKEGKAFRSLAGEPSDAGIAEQIHAAIKAVYEPDAKPEDEHFVLGHYQFYRDGRIKQMNRVTKEWKDLEPMSPDWLIAKGYLRKQMEKAQQASPGSASSASPASPPEPDPQP